MRIPTITFRVKVTLLLSGVVLLMGVIAVMHARADLRFILGGALERRGEAIAMDLAANSTDPLLTGDLVGVHELVNRAKINNPDIRYILVVSPSGQALVDTFPNGIPRGLLEANPIVPGNETEIRRLKTEEGLIRDVAATIFQGKVGTIRVGMSDLSVEAAVAENSRDLMVLVGVAVLAGLVLSYLLSYYLTRPLSNLLAVVQAVTQGDLTRRIASTSGDEVGQLGDAFNVMSSELERKEAGRQELMEKVISSQEEERKRVARELHDELAQHLTSVLFSLEAVDNTLQTTDHERKHLIKRARVIAESSLAETRKLIADLRPTVLDDLGLVPAIRSYAENRLRPVGTKVVVNVTDLPESLPSAVETAVFRIVQEAISNTVKHASAGQASISLIGTDSSLWVEVVDNGQGFQPTGVNGTVDTQQSGLGLRGMHERAVLLGGNLSIISNLGSGTKVSFSIPLRRGR